MNKKKILMAIVLFIVVLGVILSIFVYSKIQDLKYLPIQTLKQEKIEIDKRNELNLVRNETPIADFEAKLYEKFAQMYKKPIEQWQKPEVAQGVEWKEFAPLPKTAPSPKDNPTTPQKVKLGKKLFEDPKLSKSSQISCASCHNQELGFGDGLKVAIGHNRAQGLRNSPNIEVSSLFSEHFWDGRAQGLEAQALMPIQDPVEMANTLENVENAIKNDPSYYAAFIEAFGEKRQLNEWKKAYPSAFQTPEEINFPIHFLEKRLSNKPSDSVGDNVLGFTPKEKQELKEQVLALFGTKNMQLPLSAKNTNEKPLPSFSNEHIKQAQNLINIQNITKAIAAYERTLIPQDTRFNRFLQGEHEALSDKEIYGMHIFRTKGKCMNCHYGAILSDEKYHNLNVGLYGRFGQDLGRYEVTGDVKDIGAFRTPSLINVRKSAPYGHNGIFPNFIGLIHLYDKGFPVPEFDEIKNDPNKPKTDVLIEKLDLTTEEIQALEAFMYSL